MSKQVHEQWNSEAWFPVDLCLMQVFPLVWMFFVSVLGVCLMSDKNGAFATSFSMAILFQWHHLDLLPTWLPTSTKLCSLKPVIHFQIQLKSRHWIQSLLKEEVKTAV